MRLFGLSPEVALAPLGRSPGLSRWARIAIGYSALVDDDILTRLHVTNDQIAAFCRKWQIVRFELFGSALRDDFDDESDVDVLVVFADKRPVGLSDLLDMEEELQVLFGRKVDLIKRHLVEESRNWIRRRSILESARLIYAAS